MSQHQNVNIVNKEQLLEELFSDNNAFELFFRKHFVSLCGFCQLKFGFSMEAAKDIAHTAFIKLWESRLTLPPQLPVLAYLYRVINNSSLDVLKHDKVKRRYEKHLIQSASVGKFRSEFENIEFKQMNADIQAAIAELPLQMQKIFKLCRYEGLKYAEVADQMNISVKTVETQMGRASVKLRQKLSYYLAQ
ncbi:RNA polymerase sigma-70 factor [Terrimonas alba]|uniref:RNA polymerase sigma-70 factor n=1 Tax=Terrimonas alba TaxID=3349636 RepID=UPI0035F30096